MPSVAECGGFMYLHESMTDEEGENWPMAGIITGSCHNRGKLVRFGYVNVMEQTSHFLAGNLSVHMNFITMTVTTMEKAAWRSNR